ncbi:MAG TPA: hypothetical protein VN253_04645 [Kofleriaceae bacterium]|nr:hypothetical protein [Kofleriaceae bacterium]
MIRLLLFLALAAGLGYCGANVKLGKRTFFGHVKAIWATEEVQELKDGVKETAAPAASRVKRGIEKGYEAATHDDEGGSGSAARKPAPAPASP